MDTPYFLTQKLDNSSFRESPFEIKNITKNRVAQTDNMAKGEEVPKLCTYSTINKKRHCKENSRFYHWLPEKAIDHWIIVNSRRGSNPKNKVVHLTKNFYVKTFISFVYK
jgi:hypothetical protein